MENLLQIFEEIFYEKKFRTSLQLVEHCEGLKGCPQIRARIFRHKKKG